MTAEELARWQKEVASPADAEKFIEEYWRKRGEQFKKDVHTRMEFADKQFALGKVPGAETAMGRVWMLLNTPNEQKTNRTGATGAANAFEGGSPGLTGRMQDNSIERGAKVTYRWIYRKDRLPAEVGRSELIVDFNTDTQRGAQFIENPGVVEPYLRKVAEHVSNQYAMASKTRSEKMAVAPTKASTVKGSDPLWNLTPAENGAIYTGDAFVSPREAPFYAVSIFVPKDAPGMAEWKSGLLVSLVRDAAGNEVVSDRQQVELEAYDDEGNRYVDRSLALAPGKYEAIFALYSPDGVTVLSSHREQIEVAAPTVPRASKLLLTSRVENLDTQDALDPFTFVAQKYAVRGDRRFKAKDNIGLFTVVANPTGPQPQLMQKMTFTRDGKPSFKTSLEPAGVMQTGPNTYLLGLTFPPDTFKPGHYTVELQVRDFNAPEGSEARTKGYVLTSEFDVVQ
ncbi:MAG TPA: GWxTD domain-containing protein [Thermoanaerobaculia bacterium]|nr:GWxTD domain-containing protein [Thermoanaerobaculia bacterium]